MIHTRAYRSDIKRTLDQIGLHDCLVEIVESVQEWARSVGVEEENPKRVARALTADGTPLIVFKSEISEDDRSGIIGRMIFGGFEEEIAQIESPEAFLEHLVLHEAAHLLLPDGTSEDECDRWAFENLDSRFAPRTA